MTVNCEGTNVAIDSVLRVSSQKDQVKVLHTNKDLNISTCVVPGAAAYSLLDHQNR